MLTESIIFGLFADRAVLASRQNIWYRVDCRPMPVGRHWPAICPILMFYREVHEQPSRRCLKRTRYPSKRFNTGWISGRYWPIWARHPANIMKLLGCFTFNNASATLMSLFLRKQLEWGPLYEGRFRNYEKLSEKICGSFFI